jgi:hypothetical protein
VYECKKLCWSLYQNGIEVKLMWIASHVGLVENRLFDVRARQAALEGSTFDTPLFSSDFQSLARLVLMVHIYIYTGRFAHSAFPDVTLRPLFKGQKEERRFVCTMSNS